jgi:hypothetical protein
MAPSALLACEHRLEVLHYLEAANIQMRVTFAGDITRHPAYRNFLQPFDNADKIMKDGFMLGAHHGMSQDNVDYVCGHIKTVLQTHQQSSPLQAVHLQKKAAERADEKATAAPGAREVAQKGNCA